jgi:hypothetical protein
LKGEGRKGGERKGERYRRVEKNEGKRGLGREMRYI